MGVAIFNDITEQKRIEQEHQALLEQLLQTQKIEAVGQLAGGVAHDFNNMLSVILGFGELIRKDLKRDDPNLKRINELLKATRKSSDLIGQLMTFARKQPISPKVVDVNKNIAVLLKMIRRLISEDIELIYHPGHECWPILIDPIQLDQLLTNLCLNARDSISGHGKIIIETQNVDARDKLCALPDTFPPGEYTLISVGDTGCGMDSDLLQHIFEPFFTTKERGHGTGLGLSTVYGIVKQNNGVIKVYSEPGRGSMFKIFFPKDSQSVPQEEIAEPQEFLLGRGETILLVEDEPLILGMAEEMLTMLGYKVLVTTSPNEALSMAEQYKKDIHLLITDVVMPEMDGLQLVNKIKEQLPHVTYLFCSGYSSHVISEYGLKEASINLLQKPFTLTRLAQKVRQTLDGKTVSMTEVPGKDSG